MLHYIADRLQNLVSGLATAKDKRVSNIFGLNIVSPQELSAMHRGDWLARKIVDVIPHDMTREWRDWQAKGSAGKKGNGESQIEALEETERRLGLRQKAAEALQKARLYGGAVLVMGVDGDPEQELKPEAVSKDALVYLNVLNRHEVGIEDLDQDVLSPFFREPKFYTITGVTMGSARVHPSRVIRLIGAPILDTLQSFDGWGDSVLQVVYDAVQNASSSQEHVAALLPEAKLDVIKVPGLSQHLRTEQSTTELTRRFGYANTMKSMFSMLLLEGDGQTGESWEQKQINFTQFPELLRLFLQVAAGAADIPVTRLLGESPAGLNATGDSDIRNYYDNISARQEVELRPALSRLDEVLIRSSLGTRPPEIYYEWSPLWQLSAKEKAEVNKMNAEAAERDANMGLIPPPALARARTNQLIENGVYPGLEAALDEYGEEPGEYALAAIEAEEEMQLEMAKGQISVPGTVGV